MAKASRGGKRAPGENTSRELDVELTEKNTGASYNKLSAKIQDSIKRNLTLSDALRKDIEGGGKYAISDEWKTGLKGKGQEKVEWRYNGRNLVYTVKSGNKILLKNGTKGQAANKIAKFYIDTFGAQVLKDKNE